MNHDLTHPIAGLVFGGVVAFAGLAAEVPDPTWQQGTVAAGLFAVVLFFIKRGDAREDSARASLAGELKTERDAHQRTRELLAETARQCADCLARLDEKRNH